MTCIEMIKILGEQIELVRNTTDGSKAKVCALKDAEAIARLAKQHSNEVDLVIRGDKMCGRTDRINEVLG